MARTASEAIFDALFRLIDEESASTVCRQTDIAPSTITRWKDARAAQGRASFTAENFDKLMRIDEIRAAASAALRRTTDENQAAWEEIAGALSELLSPAAGWTLVKKLRRLRDLGLMDSRFSVFDGLINQRIGAATESQRSGNSATGKAKSGA